MVERFKDRQEAGKLLAEKLLQYKTLNPVILALPRGGVPVAHEVASKLHAPLDVVLVKKIGAPRHEEFAIGAIAEDETPILNQAVIDEFQFDPDEIQDIITDKIMEIRRRSKVYRQKIPAVALKSRAVIVVDDGLATGATMLAAVEWLRNQQVSKIIVAVPVSSLQAAEELKRKVDGFVSLLTPANMMAVGIWYAKFPQTSDEEVLSYFSQKTMAASALSNKRDIKIDDGDAVLRGVVSVPQKPRGMVVFAHGGGSSHKSPRNIFVADALNQAGFATLLFDLLTEDEFEIRKNVFDIPLITKRLLVATDWTRRNYPDLAIGYFGASTGAAAALGAAVDRTDIFAVVSRGGRPDLAMTSLPKVYAPTLLIVGSEDGPVISMNFSAKEKLRNCQMVLVPGAGHLFEEPGTLDQVVEHAINWFSNSLLLYLEKKVDSDLAEDEFDSYEDMYDDDIEENLWAEKTEEWISKR